MGDSVTAAIKGRSEKAQVHAGQRARWLCWSRQQALRAAPCAPLIRSPHRPNTHHPQGAEAKAPKRKRAPNSDDEYAAASSDDDDFYDRCVWDCGGGGGSTGGTASPRLMFLFQRQSIHTHTLTIAPARQNRRQRKGWHGQQGPWRWRGVRGPRCQARRQDGFSGC